MVTVKSLSKQHANKFVSFLMGGAPQKKLQRKKVTQHIENSYLIGMYEMSGIIRRLLNEPNITIEEIHGELDILEMDTTNHARKVIPELGMKIPKRTIDDFIKPKQKESYETTITN